MTKNNSLVVPQEIAYGIRAKWNGKHVYYQSQKSWCMTPNFATIFMGFDIAVDALAAYRVQYPDTVGTDFEVITIMGAFMKANA